MSRSLQRHLSLMLSVMILATGFVAAIASFLLSYSEARDFQDDMLKQIAIVSTGPNPAPGGMLNDPESRFLVFHFPADRRPQWLPGGLGAGFHTLETKGGRFRLYVRIGRNGRTVVAQLTDARDEIAFNSALRTLIPLLLLLPLLAWLITRIVKGELAPVRYMAMNLDSQDRPRQIEIGGLPEEIVPFVQAINRLFERVSELMDQQRRFIADAAHELRSPLTALSLQAGNLMGAKSIESMLERAIPLEAGIERARRLTEQLLNLARTQSGSNDDAVVDIPEMSRQLIAEYLPAAEKKRIDLGLEQSARLKFDKAPAILRLVVKNALDNALKYTPEGGVVTLRLLENAIEVVDSGPGIPEAEREKVFQPFYRVLGTDGEGSGLGLAIAKEAAARLGGSLSLDDSEGSGLIFRYRP
ncbi:MAG TPA: ATP-binding protein [Burkholderiales bacterium]|nr:ATP-binding protein [Burkholderiales bacterium]